MLELENAALKKRVAELEEEGSKEVADWDAMIWRLYNLTTLKPHNLTTLKPQNLKQCNI